ncbi:MAG: four helix bundle protein [Chitinophagaceae bacterium]|jgi:four helix bundle protein|nr:MAG: four helix bundle protein [Chitinophagaceae bacterium]
MTKSELEKRLILFAVMVIEIVNDLPNTKAGNHLGSQLVRSGTSPALNYGEAQSGESKRDFVHKIKIVLKELRETLVCLKIIEEASLYPSKDKLQSVIKENDELVSIFVKSSETAEKNLRLAGG